jgi:hypothetical protein
MRLLYAHPNQIVTGKEQFEAAFPEVMQIAEQLKRIRYQNFATTLQWYEATIMLGAVADRLTSAGISLLTLHDCAIVPEKDETRTVEILLADFERVIGTAPKLHRQKLNASG